MKITRREFIEKSMTGVGSVLLASRLDAVSEKAAEFYDPFELVTLGKTKVKVSRVAQGTGMRGGQRQSNQTRLGKAEFERLIRYGYDQGIRFFDLADLYGSHPYAASALSSIPRENYGILTKIWWRRGGLPESERPDADAVIERFRKELRTDYIDIVLLHCVEAENWPEELRKQMDIMESLKQKGVIKAHGVSCHSLNALEAAVDEPWTDVVLARINPYGTKMDGPPEQVVPVLQKLHRAGKAVIGMKLIGEGEFRNSDEKRDHSVRFVFGLDCVDAVTVGFEKTSEIDDFVARVRKAPRSTAKTAYLRSITPHLAAQVS